MDTFAETAIVDHCLSFVDQEKQTSVLRFRLEQTNKSMSLPFSIFRKYIKFAGFTVSSVYFLQNHGDMETWRNVDMET